MQLNINNILYMPVIFTICFARVWGVGNMLKFLANHTISTMARHSIFIIFTIPIFIIESLNYNCISKINSFSDYCFCLAQEVFIGTIIGFSTMLPFWAIDFGCFIIDTMRGTAIGAALNPVLGTQSSGLGLLFSQLLSVIFLSSGGLNALLLIIYKSYVVFPISLNSLLIMTGWKLFLQTQFRLMFELGISFSIPSIVIMALIDISLGLISIGSTQLNIFFLAMPIKSILCILLLAISLPFSINLCLNTMLGNEHIWFSLLTNK